MTALRMFAAFGPLATVCILVWLYRVGRNEERNRRLALTALSVMPIEWHFARDVIRISEGALSRFSIHYTLGTLAEDGLVELHLDSINKRPMYRITADGIDRVNEWKESQ